MGLFSRMFGGQEPEPRHAKPHQPGTSSMLPVQASRQVPPAGLTAHRAGNVNPVAPPSATRPVMQIGAHAESSWDYLCNVVGESHYQGTFLALLREALGREAPNSGEVRVWVQLVPEPNNVHDRNAVAAHVAGQKVGYMQRGYLSNAEIAVLHQYDVYVAAAIGWSQKPIFGVRLDLVDGDLLGRPRAPKPLPQSTPVPVRSSAGNVDGKHFTEYVDVVKTLKRLSHNEAAVDLLIKLVAATEKEAEEESTTVAPWYYEQLAIVYRKLGRPDDELSILQRFREMPRPAGASAQKVLDRLDKLSE